MRGVVGSTDHGAWLGTFEHEKLRHFVKRLRPGMTVWDLGANVGLYTLPSARAVGMAGRVFAFEPLARNLVYLNHHIALNALRNVTVCGVAVGGATQRVRMAGGDSPAEFHIDPDGGVEVPAVALDDWRVRTACPLPDIVKIDVEGAEDAVLRGGAETFSRGRPPISLALHGERQRLACGALLARWGYRVVSMERGLGPDVSSEWLAEPV